MARQPAECGTISGYRRHLRREDEPCAECRAAHASYMRGYTVEYRKSTGNVEKMRRVKRGYGRRVYASRTPEYRLADWLKKYGLTIESRDAMLRSQGGCCAICSTTDPRAKGWHVDHDHSRGLTAVRGILCDRCNRVLGMMGDTLESVTMLGWIPGIAYLDRAAQRFALEDDHMTTALHSLTATDALTD